MKQIISLSYTPLYLIAGSMMLGQTAMADNNKQKVVSVIQYNKEPENEFAKKSKGDSLPSVGQGGYVIQNKDNSKRTEGVDRMIDEMEYKNHNKNRGFTSPKTASSLPEDIDYAPQSYTTLPPATTPSMGPAGRRNTPNYPTQTQYGLNVNPDICSPKSAMVGIRHFKYNEPLSSELVWSGFGSKNEERYKIHRDAKDALYTLVNAAKADGVTLKPSSIFRSIRRQQQIITDKLKTQDPYEVYHTSSPAGYSEHHTGFAVDFGSIDESFTTTRAYHWLSNNAYRYGWEQTFTPEYSAYSGVSEESWHWRYIGQNREFSHIFQHSKQRAC